MKLIGRSLAGARLAVAALAAALVCLVLATIGASPAATSGAASRDANGEAETQLCTGCKPPLVYDGSRVMGTATRAGEITITPIFWGASNAFPGNYKALIDRYINDIAVASGHTDNVYSVNTEYYERVNGATRKIQYVFHNGGEKDDLNAFPGNGCAVDDGFTRCISDAQLRAQLNTFTSARGLPADRAHLYPVFLPPNVETAQGGQTSNGGFCGYHSAYQPTSTRLILYGNEPFPPDDGCGQGQSPNGNPSADSAIDTLSHEINESITDPVGGWADQADPANENADECASAYGDPIDSVDPDNPQTTQYNQVINNNPYYTQEAFSNTDFAAGSLRGCVQREDDAGASIAQAAAPGSTAPAATAAAAKPANDIALDANDYTLAADGVSTTQVTVDVDDNAGNPVAGDHVHFKIASDTPGQPCGKLSALNGFTDADGHLEVTYTASKGNASCDVIGIEAKTGQSGDVSIDQGTEDANTPTVTSTAPSAVREGTPVTFTTTWTNPSAEVLHNSRLDVVLYGDDTAATGLTASQVHLSYADESTGGQFRSVPLSFDTIDDGEIDGYLAPLTGFDFPANHSRTTTFRLLIDKGAPTSAQTLVPLTAEFDFDRVVPATGFTSTLADAEPDIWVAPAPAACTSTVTGNVGATTVPAGQTVCFNGANVNGPLTVQPGGGATLTNTRVAGAVDAESPTSFTMCGSTASTDVTVRNSSGFVLLGDPGDDGCAANVIGRSLNLSGNHGDAELVGNRVGGSVAVDSTTGHGPFADDSAAELESNVVQGNLECSGNSPAPTDDHHPNTVGGARLGQCATAGF